MDKMLGKGAEQVFQQDTATINDSTQRLAFLQEKIDDLRDAIDKADKLKTSQQEHLGELKTRMDKL